MFGSQNVFGQTNVGALNNIFPQQASIVLLSYYWRKPNSIRSHRDISVLDNHWRFAHWAVVAIANLLVISKSQSFVSLA
jgi:hypothetical protein